MNFITPDDAGFEEAVLGRIFNGRRPDRRPDAVLFAQSEQDVVDGVLLARERGWTVAVRSGGHSWAAWSVRDGGLLIDLGALRETTYDAATGIASAQPAVQGGDELAPMLEERGAFFHGGHCPSVGVGGFLLQGGQGWNQRGWGWAAEAVTAVDVVTAEGELVRADPTQNQDLYWAARGSGPSFPGIVTRFHLATRPMPRAIAHTLHLYDVADFTEVMSWLYVAQADISVNVEIVAVGLTSPAEEGPRMPRLIVSALALCDTREEAVAALAPFNASPALSRAIVVQDARETTMAEQRADQVRANPPQAHYRVDNAWVDGPVDEVVERLRPLFTELPTPAGFTIMICNEPVRPLPDMAFSLQAGAYIASYMVFDDPADDAVVKHWLDARMTELEPVTAGQYLGDSDMANRQLRFMADANFARLQAIIADRDPGGRFARYLASDASRLNANHWQ